MLSNNTLSKHRPLIGVRVGVGGTVKNNYFVYTVLEMTVS